MTESSRRGFLKYAGAGVVAAGAATVAPSVLAGQAAGAEPEPEQKLPAEAHGSMAAYVDDVKSDEMTLMVEGREVVVRDKALVTRLARHLHAG